MRSFVLILCLLAAMVPGAAATLEKLTLDDMIQKSTTIVRGRVQSCSGESRGPVIYTRCKVAASERWKGSGGAIVDVLIPGGTAQGFTQTFAGSPSLNLNDEYILFLWTGKNGITQVIGLSQGAFTIKLDSKGDLQAQRDPISERMLDASGGTVQDKGLQLGVQDLKDRVVKAVSPAPTKAGGQE